MTKRIAAVQSSYIPWKGYLDLIAHVDEFVLYDDVQYTRRDWRNRNLIKTKDGLHWLTIPVATKGRYLEPIRAIAVGDVSWPVVHWKTIATSYARARHFRSQAAFLEELYLGTRETLLSAVNRRFLEALCRLLAIPTRLTFSMDYQLSAGRNERLLDLCLKTGASVYVSGPSARGYLDVARFREQGVDVEFFNYQGYPEYEQLHPPFVHEVSVIDLILNTGEDAPKYLLRSRT